MLDLETGPAVATPEPSRATPALGSPSPDRSLGREPSGAGGAPSPHLPLFERGFDLAYSTPARPGRGAAVLHDTRYEARTFGGEYAVQSLEAERFGPAVRPDVNQQLAGALRTPAGQEAVLLARAPGIPPPSRGDDLVVLIDRTTDTGGRSVAGAGHSALLVGNDRTGWTLHSKDGTPDNLGFTGRPLHTNDAGAGQSDGPRHATYRTLDDFFRDRNTSDRYEAAVRFEFEPGMNPNRGADARAAADRIIAENYHLTRSSCATTVEAALQAAGIQGFTAERTRATLNPFDGDRTERVRVEGIIPNRQFDRAVRAEGADDVRSEARSAWEARAFQRENPTPTPRPSRP